MTKMTKRINPHNKLILSIKIFSLMLTPNLGCKTMLSYYSMYIKTKLETQKQMFLAK